MMTCLRFLIIVNHMFLLMLFYFYFLFRLVLLLKHENIFLFSDCHAEIVAANYCFSLLLLLKFSCNE